MWSLITVIAVFSPDVGVIDFEAERLEATRYGWTATGPFILRTGPFEMSGAHLTKSARPNCPGGEYSTRSALIVKGLSLQITAGDAQYCRDDGRLRARTVTFKSSGFRGRARFVNGSVSSELRNIKLTLKDASFTGCACEKPAWSITATKASVNPKTGGWVSWPVLWLGKIPVAASPIWYVPFGSRRSGLLLPRVSWRDDENFQMIVPAYLVLNSHADLEIGPGWRNGSTAVATTRIRWATPEAQRGSITGLAVGRDLRIEADGQIGSQQFFIHTAGEFVSAPTERHRLTKDWQLGSLQHTTGLLSARGVFDGLSLQLDGLIAQDTDWPDLWSKKERQNPARFMVNGWTELLGLTMGNAVVSNLIWHPRHEYIHRLSAHPTVAAQLWLGILNIDATMRGHAVGYTGKEQINFQDDYRLEGHAKIAMRVGLTGRRGSVTHRSFLGIHGQLSDLRQRGIDSDETVWFPGFEERSVKAVWLNEWTKMSSLVRARIYHGYDDAISDRPWQPVSGDFSWQSAQAMVSTTVVGLRYQRFWMRFGPSAQTFFSLGALHVAPSDSDTFWLRNHSSVGTFLRTSPQNERWTLTPGLGTELGPLALRWAGAIDPDHHGLIGHNGSLAWSGRCRCWSIAVVGSHEPQPKRVRLFVSFQLTTHEGSDTTRL